MDGVRPFVPSACGLGGEVVVGRRREVSVS